MCTLLHTPAHQCKRARVKKIITIAIGEEYSMDGWDTLVSGSNERRHGTRLSLSVRNGRVRLQGMAAVQIKTGTHTRTHVK